MQVRPLAPCAICAQAIALACLRQVQFSAYDSKGGGVEHGTEAFCQPTCHHRPEVIGGVEETGCGALLRGLLRDRR